MDALMKDLKANLSKGKRDRDDDEHIGPDAKKQRVDLKFTIAQPSYFALDQLEQKGKRKTADVGSPSDASRNLFKADGISVGSWSCTEGGFTVPPRTSTEVFYVMEGEGSVSDKDGTAHAWKPGDTVILPKGWTGRWDITKAIHKVCVVYDNVNVQEGERAIVGTAADFEAANLIPLGERKEADHGEPVGASRKLYNVGPVSVGAWSCTPGGFPVVNRPTIFHVLEGVGFLTNTDGSAQRITAGDTVVLPKGWHGRWDIIETIRTVFAVTSD